MIRRRAPLLAICLIAACVLEVPRARSEEPTLRRPSGRRMPGLWLTEVAKLTASDAAMDDHLSGLYAGHAIDGENAVIGAPGDDNQWGVDAGAAYLFTRVGDSWTEQEKFVSSDAEAGDGFGAPVVVTGSTIFVTSLWDDHSVVDAGAVYVFGLTPEGVAERQKLTAPFPTVNDCFGWSLAVHDDTLAIGSASHWAAGETGSAHVFVRSGDNWVHHQELVASDGAAGDLFGHYASLTDGVLVIGAPGAEISGQDHRGSAYVFSKVGDLWVEQQKLEAGDGVGGDEFGISVALSGNTLLVGAKFGDSPTQSDTGAAYVFERAVDTWVEQQKIYPSDGGASDLFGDTVVLDGDRAVVSAVDHDHAAGSNAGALYVFVRTDSEWVEREICTTSDAASFDRFGWGPPISGSTLMAGAPDADLPGILNAGAVYVFQVATFFDGFESGDTSAWSRSLP